MAHPADAARGRNIVARWCNLAERRLEHLTELFESGRWRRYHSEREFLENIQEAKVAVETWRDLLSREAAPDNTAIDLTWLGRRRTTPLPLTPLPRDQGLHQPIVQPQPKPVQVQLKPVQQSKPVQFQPKPVPVVAAAPPTPPRDVPPDVLVALENHLAAAAEASSAPDVLRLDEIQFPTLDLDVMKERYPLLRNAL
jgi:uncharacterized repeat protein (TIGR03809 family)